jgi:hypothetical protein
MPTIEETLERLAVTFVVRDIMIPSESLVCAANPPEAAKASDGHPDFNVIPIRQKGSSQSASNAILAARKKSR